MLTSDVCVAGGGLIGLSIALEMARRGAEVTVIERDAAMAGASQAAAGMLAVEDPENPEGLRGLARMSIDAYPEFLSRVEALGGLAVPYQTNVTFQAVEEASGRFTAERDLPRGLVSGARRFARLAEHSVDPRQMAAGVLAAVRASAIRLVEHTTVRAVGESSRGVVVQTSEGELHAGHVVFALGAWGFPPVRPRKGQMLAVRMPAEATDCVVRTPEVYMVPRLFGPRAGQVVIGATVEDAGFSTGTDAASLTALRSLAAALLPALGDEAEAPEVSRWAGLRPDTPDHLPLIGTVADGRQMIAGGHYRNGILLAPGTALVVARMLTGEDAGVDLNGFSPRRFG